ncbi:hypothetical protein [Brevibacillus porteri]|uniref:hypothetical protein n=1 Tax=Brevibacillus porteri TaxID=2126350 RepID=UPI003640EFE4
MNFLKKYSKLILSFALFMSVVFSGQSIGHAEDQYSEDLVPKMTSNTDPSGKVSSSRVYELNEPWYAFDESNIPWIGYGKTGWLEYEFPEPTRIDKYTIQDYNLHTSPKDWSFEAWDGSNWVILDTQKDVTYWSEPYRKREFTFNNSNTYSRYRINITAGNSTNDVISILEMELMQRVSTTPDPDPNPDPDPKPEPTGENALLVIKMISGLEKEFDLSTSEVQDFIDWYNSRADGRGKETYMFDKDFNKGPFTARKDYVAFSKIQSFEVMEYTK